jgi:hypothetical protein
LNGYNLSTASRPGASARLQDPGAYDPGDWAWEFLRRNPDYRADWRASVPRHLPHLTLRDGTQVLRLRRRYPRAEQWGLYAFTDPFQRARTAPVFWLPTATRRVVRARCAMPRDRQGFPSLSLASFKVIRTAVIGVDTIPVVMMKGQGVSVVVEIHGLAALTSAFEMVFELDGFGDLNTQTECLKLLQRFMNAEPAGPQPTLFTSDERLRHALIALDESMAGKTYRQIAITIFGDKRVAEEWGGASQFLKDRTRRLVAKGKELMAGGYRDLLR